MSATVDLTPAEVAERFRTGDSTVRWWRLVGKGPPSIRIGKRVLYPVEGIREFEAGLRAAATRQAV